MPPYIAPSVRVLVLEGFIARPGHAARPGELVDVAPHVANTAIAQGKARLPTTEDAPQGEESPTRLESRDPTPTHRDPKPSRRTR